MKTVNLTEEEHAELLKLRAAKKTVAAEAMEDNVVRAAGTSEGAKKGWTHRTLAQAHLMAGTLGHMANEKTRLVKGEAESYAYNHDEAERFHRAASQHYKEVAEMAGEEGNLPIEKDAKERASHHESKAELHSGKAGNIRSVAKMKASDTASTDIVHCRASSAAGEKLGASAPWKPGEQVQFMWMPAGVSTICAGFRKGSIELTVACDEATAEAVQASLENWRNERPKQEPFGCVEHREQEASFRISASGGFKWNGDGVYLAAEPTTLGAQNVNGKVHRSWSPSFTTDADYSKATEHDGVLQFPEGVRGSRSNPAQITGVDFCVGTLTNKPAFHSMSPVRSREAVMASGTSEGAKKGWYSRVQGGLAHHHLHGDKAFYSVHQVSDRVGNGFEDRWTAGGIGDDMKPFNVGGIHKSSEEAKKAVEKHDNDSAKATDLTSTSTITAHCKENLLRDVPDATKAEIAQYEKCIDEGGAHSDAVYEIRKERKNGFVSSQDFWRTDSVAATWSDAARKAAALKRSENAHSMSAELEKGNKDFSHFMAYHAHKNAASALSEHIHEVGKEGSPNHEIKSKVKDHKDKAQDHLKKSGQTESGRTAYGSEPTLDSIFTKVNASLTTANRLAEENGVCKLTAADVYERHSVRAGAPMGNKNAAGRRGEVTSPSEEAVKIGKIADESSNKAEDEAGHRSAMSFHKEAEGWHRQAGNKEEAERHNAAAQKHKEAIEKKTGKPYKSFLANFANKASQAKADLESIYARAGANR